MIGERRKGEGQKVTAISHTNFLVLKEALYSIRVNIKQHAASSYLTKSFT